MPQLSNRRRNLGTAFTLAIMAGSLSFVAGDCDEDSNEQRSYAVLAVREACVNPGGTVHLDVRVGLSVCSLTSSSKVTFNGGASADLVYESGAYTAVVPAAAKGGYLSQSACATDPTLPPPSITIPCPSSTTDGGPNDAGQNEDSGTQPVTGPSCAFVVTDSLPNVTASANSGRVGVIAAAAGAGATAVDALIDGAIAPVAVGACGTPAIRNNPSDMLDLGTTVALNDGATKLADLSRQTDNSYRGFGGAPPLPFGKAITVVQSSAIVAPTVAVGNFPPDFTLTAPALVANGTPVTVTRGQPVTFTWTAPAGALSGVYALFSANNIVCSFDPTATTGTVPGTVTANMTTGQSGAQLIVVRANKTQTAVNGTPCALRSALRVGRGGPIDIQ